MFTGPLMNRDGFTLPKADQSPAQKPSDLPLRKTLRTKCVLPVAKKP